MDPRKLQPQECQARTDLCYQNLSAFCDEPVDIMAYVEMHDKPFLTVRPTGQPEMADDKKCEQTIDKCQQMFTTQCDNAFRVVPPPQFASGRARIEDTTYALGPRRGCTNQFQYVGARQRAFLDAAISGLY